MIAELIIAGASFFSPQLTRDSLGIETVNGKVFVIHKVSEKETLFAISKRYGSTVDGILQNNPNVSSASLEVGQILKVPYTRPVTTGGSKNTPRTGGAPTHKVAAKETMFSIAQKYDISVDELKQWNHLTDNTLSIGQELIVRKPAGAAAINNTPKNTQPVTTGAKKAETHTVAAKETLFSIARQYNITVAQLRTWNPSLQNDELQVGQTLQVAEPGKTETARHDVATTTTVKPNVTETKSTTTEKQPDVVKTPVTTPDKPAETITKPTATETIRISESVKNSDEILESGLAELIEGTEGNRKYLALHRTAPAGTILKVRNEMNNREVFVRVMGKLPDTGSTDKVVIRISKSAYDRLGAIDPKFRVEVTYYK
jgi:LysM repeat protein